MKDESKPYQFPNELLKLWKSAGTSPMETVGELYFFDPIGLILLNPLRNYGYWCTPINSVAFAATGGDGVHFNLLSIDRTVTDYLPVVMTVPASDNPNVVVGKNLTEFLALGSKYGYFSLDGLVHNREKTLQEIKKDNFQDVYEDRERELLGRISTAFNVSPWSDPEKRLHELDEEFGNLI